MNILQWFDGKKTIIAAVLLTISAFCSQVVVGIWHVDWAWVAPLIDTLEWIGMSLGGVGLLHKGIKNTTEK